MNYQQTLDYLFEKLPMYHRIGAAAYKADLSNTKSLCALLGNPEKQLNTIHVGGTNGKGSTSHMLASILQESGYKTGLYTSPHYTDFRDRIKINGEKISEDFVVHFIEKWKTDFEKIGLSFFEMTVGMAFDYFVKEKVDFAVIEVGLGGRLDSTNVITPLVSIITNIGKDHTHLLGDTLPEIAFEKAGIIKPMVPVVIGETNAETDFIFIETSRKYYSPIVFANQRWKIVTSDQIDNNSLLNVFCDNELRFSNLEFPLKGSFQHKNLCTVLQATEELFKQKLRLTTETITKGIIRVVENTGLQGRWQIIGKNPLVICDSGHNEPAVREIVFNLSKIKYANLRIVFGMVNDKDHNAILNLLPKNADYYFCKANIPRGLDAKILAGKAAEAGLSGKEYHSVAEAYKTAISESSQNDLVFVGGSIFVVAEVLQIIEC